MDHLVGDTKDLEFEGFASLYDGEGNVVDKIIVIFGLRHYNYNFTNILRVYLSSRTGKELYCEDTYYPKRYTKHEKGFTYVGVIQDLVGNNYYIGLLESTEKVLNL